MPQGYNYRAEVRKLIPQLQVLDERPAAHTGLPASRKLDQDWLMVKEAIKEGSILDSLRPRLGTAAARLASGKGCPTPGLVVSPSEPQEPSLPHGRPKTKAVYHQPPPPGLADETEGLINAPSRPNLPSQGPAHLPPWPAHLPGGTPVREKEEVRRLGGGGPWSVGES